MISIQENITELEREHRERDLFAECYTAAVRNAAHYAVDLDPSITELYRKELTEFATGIAGADSHQIAAGQSDLRSIFRDYRDRAANYLNRLRSQLADTVAAFQALVESFTAAEGDHDVQLRKAVATLRQVIPLIEASRIRETLTAATDNIEQSLEQLHKQHQATIAEFVTETRLLHTRIDQLEHAAAMDQLGSLFSRAELEERIRAASTPLTLLLVKAGNLRACEKTYNPEIYAQMTSAFAQRLRNGLPPNSVTGRWEDELFLSITPATENEALACAKWAADYLSGSYVCRSSGKAVVPKLKVSASVLTIQPGDSGPEFFNRISRRFQSL